MLDYNKIDPLCIPMIKYFNSIGLTTKYSCQGHNDGINKDFYIMFDSKVTDKNIEDFLLKYNNIYSHSPFVGKFYKWMRKCSDEIVTNWEYRVSWGECEINQKCAQKDLEEMKER